MCPRKTNKHVFRRANVMYQEQIPSSLQLRVSAMILQFGVPLPLLQKCATDLSELESACKGGASASFDWDGGVLLYYLCLTLSKPNLGAMLKIKRRNRPFTFAQKQVIRKIAGALDSVGDFDLHLSADEIRSAHALTRDFPLHEHLSRSPDSKREAVVSEPASDRAQDPISVNKRFAHVLATVSLEAKSMVDWCTIESFALDNTDITGKQDRELSTLTKLGIEIMQKHIERSTTDRQTVWMSFHDAAMIHVLLSRFGQHIEKKSTLHAEVSAIVKSAEDSFEQADKLFAIALASPLRDNDSVVVDLLAWQNLELAESRRLVIELQEDIGATTQIQTHEAIDERDAIHAAAIAVFLSSVKAMDPPHTRNIATLDEALIMYQEQDKARKAMEENSDKICEVFSKLELVWSGIEESNKALAKRLEEQEAKHALRATAREESVTKHRKRMEGAVAELNDTEERARESWRGLNRT